MHNTLDCCHTFTYSLTHSFTHYFSRFFLLLLCLLFVFDDENSSQLETNVLRLFVNTLEILLALFLCFVLSLWLAKMYGPQNLHQLLAKASSPIFALIQHTHSHTTHSCSTLSIHLNVFQSHFIHTQHTHSHTCQFYPVILFTHALSLTHSVIHNICINVRTIIFSSRQIYCLSVCLSGLSVMPLFIVSFC